jgi:hypothetical protein
VPAAAVKAGQFYVLGGEGKANISARPAAPFLASMPVAFRDTLPSRLAKVAGRKVVLKPAQPLSYGELAPWLAADDAVLRRHFVQRFGPRLDDPQFRGAVSVNMRAHPEWDPVLHPEKYANADGSRTKSVDRASADGKEQAGLNGQHNSAAGKPAMRAH